MSMSRPRSIQLTIGEEKATGRQNTSRPWSGYSRGGRHRFFASGQSQVSPQRRSIRIQKRRSVPYRDPRYKTLYLRASSMVSGCQEAEPGEEDER